MNLFSPEIKLEKQLQAQIYNALEGDVVNFILSNAGDTPDDIYHRSEMEGQSMKVDKDVMGDFYKLCMDVKARLGFAINVSIHPEILIVDEALSVGDKSFRKKCKEKIRELVEDENVTFLFVTHSTAVAEEFCTRGLVMKKGKLIFDGEISEAAAFYDEMIEREDAEKAERRRKRRERRLAEKRALEKKENL